MDCKYYHDEFCVNANSPCVADYCPCVEYPGLCKYYKSLQDASKERRRSKQLHGQLDLFDIIKEKKDG